MKEYEIWARCKKCGKIVTDFYKILEGRITRELHKDGIHWVFVCKDCLEGSSDEE